MTSAPGGSPGGPGDADTGEEGMASADPDAAGDIGVGMVPDDYAEGAAALQEARDEGELTRPS